ALCIALWNRHIAVVKLLLINNTINPNLKDNVGRIPLFLAARNGSRKLFKLLLSNNRVKPDTKNYYALILLLIAVANRREEVVELLLAINYINFNYVDSFGQTPL
ncbi:ankyrin, partial [Cenococcum geophilum]